MPAQNRTAGIALCLSGGGYRAATFHLGVLAYLNRLQLLQQVEILSTVSGGTLAGLAYARSLKKKTGFEQFYSDFTNFLLKTNLIKLSFSKIGNKSSCALGYKNLITSISDIYDKYLFSGDQFNIFWHKPSIHLQEIIFNTTEFRTGIDFRFQKSKNTLARMGNGNVNISLRDAQKIRLADIAAASSCFPGGFEPLAFPHDFKWPGNKIPDSLAEKFEKALPIMDGGIYDNQGVDAALLAIQRCRNKIGMFIISDTDKNNEEIFSYPEIKNNRSLSLSIVNKLLLTLMLLSAFSSIALITNLIALINQTGITILSLFIYGFPAVVLGSLAYFIYWLRKKVKNEVLDRIPQIRLAAWKEIKHLTIDQVIDMAELRIRSLFALAGSVFMKRIRSLVFAHVYKNPGYENKRVSNLIYELDGSKKYRTLWLKPSDKMQKNTCAAANMPTVLWFDDPADLSRLIACGEYTICYNLIDFILRIDKNHKAKYPYWFKQAVEDWKSFEQDPLMMIAQDQM
ncbi:MAG: patatin-like phospholipase family protein [Bacteroidetes bacterium]|nr:patatin-like phospholipase family protein [Bacteroidota bacterium]